MTAAIVHPTAWPAPRRRSWRDAESVNTRDLGGLPVRHGGFTRPGVVYRADSAGRSVPSVAVHLAARHGRAQVLDLRDADEVTDLSGPPPGITVHRFPMSDPAVPRVRPAVRDHTYFAEQYAAMLPRAHAATGLLLRHLVADDAPLVVTCRVGKDRTGVVTIVLLAALGVPRRWIERDFALTARSYLDATEWVSAYARSRNEDVRDVLRRFVLPPSVIRAPLALILNAVHDRDEWAGRIGVDRDTFERAADRLVTTGESR